MSTSQQPSVAPSDYWKKCNICKRQISYRAKYWVCNVSTCNRKRLGLVFCTTACWDAHLPMMNHRESWAEERKAPSREEYEQQLREENEPVKRERKVKTPSGGDESPQSDSASVSTSAPKVIVRRTKSGE